MLRNDTTLRRKAFSRNAKGQALVEYIMLTVFVSIGCIFALLPLTQGSFFEDMYKFYVTPLTRILEWDVYADKPESIDWTNPGNWDYFEAQSPPDYDRYDGKTPI